MPKLEVTVIEGHLKKIDPDAYGVKRRDPVVKLVLGEQEFKTIEQFNTLNPVWGEIFTFEVSDPTIDKLLVTLYLGDVQIGTEGSFFLTELKRSVTVYKGLGVPNGKIDLSLKALEFGQEEESEAESEDDWLTFI